MKSFVAEMKKYEPKSKVLLCVLLELKFLIFVYSPFRISSGLWSSLSSCLISLRSLAPTCRLRRTAPVAGAIVILRHRLPTAWTTTTITKTNDSRLEIFESQAGHTVWRIAPICFCQFWYVHLLESSGISRKVLILSTAERKRIRLSPLQLFCFLSQWVNAKRIVIHTFISNPLFLGRILRSL